MVSYGSWEKNNSALSLIEPCFKIGKLLVEGLSSVEINSSTISSETTVPAGISCLLSNVKTL